MNKDSLENWKIASDIFEKYFDTTVDQAINAIEKEPLLSAEAKSIAIRLIKARISDNTLVEEAHLDFFNSLQEEKDLSGSTIDEYQLICQIGKGGMSHVYKARRKNSQVQKYVAIKILSTAKDAIDKSLESLFIQEQKTLAKLSHPNIISFHFGAISAESIFYLVMDYINEPQSIREFCLAKGLKTKQIIQLYLSVLDALSYAHQQLVVHKDIKPSNILVDKQGIVYVVDFGIATILSSSENDNNKQIYTPNYASPEQINKQNIGITSDIFSVSALLLELLTKSKPLEHFKGGKVDFKHCKNHFQKLIKQKDLPNDLQNIVLKGLQEKPENRYQSVQEMKTDLQNWLLSKPISASKHSYLYLLKKLVYRHPLSSTFISVLFIGIIYANIALFNSKEQALLQAKNAKQVTSFLIDSIRASDPDITKGKDVTVKEFLNNAKVNAKFSRIEDPFLMANLKQTIGNALVKVGQYKEAESLLQQAIKIDEKNFDAYVNLIQMYFSENRIDEASNNLKLLQENIKNVGGSQRIKVLQLEATLLNEQGSFKQAQEKIIQSIELAKQNKNQQEEINGNIILSQIFENKGENKQSVAVLEQTLSLSELFFGQVSTTTMHISKLLADGLGNLSPMPFDKIMKLYKKTLNIQKQLYGNTHPEVAKTHLQYGFALKSRGLYSEAKKQALLAKKIANNLFGNQHILTAHVDVLLSQVYYFEDNITQAIKLLTSVINIYEKTYGENHFETNQVKTTQALYFVKNNQGEQALRILLPMYNQQIEQMGEAHQSTVYIALNILHAYNLEKNYLQTIEFGKKQLKLSIQHLGEDSILTVGLKATLAEAYIYTKQANLALGLLAPIVEMTFIKNNPGYFKKISLLLIKAHVQTKNYEQSNQIIKSLITTYYHSSKPDDFYREIISLQK